MKNNEWMKPGTTEFATKSSPAMLARMMQQQDSLWLDSEFGEILEHQLETPIANSDQITPEAPPRTCRQILLGSNPELAALEAVKQLAKTERDSPDVPAEVATVIYYAAIGKAQQAHQQLITELDSAQIADGIRWCLELPWITDELKTLFVELAEDRR